MQKINWQDLPPSYQSLNYSVEALLLYLEKKDAESGIKSAQKYLELNQVPTWVPLRSWFARQARVILDIGKTLSDPPDPDSIKYLADKMSRAHILHRPLIAWALEIAYLKKGEIQKANQMRAFITQTAPHCAAFTRRTDPKGVEVL
jgi:hypothetical protein